MSLPRLWKTSAVLVVAVLSADVYVLVARNSQREVSLQDSVRKFRRQVAESASPVAAPTQRTVPVEPAERPEPGQPPSSQTQPEVTVRSEVGPPAAPAAQFGKPAPGVYSIATQGFEELSMFGGARHDYPAETYGVVTHESGCTWAFDHEVLREHRDILGFCHEGDSTDFDRWLIRRTFLNYTITKDFRCRGESMIMRSRWVAGDAVEFDCWTTDDDRAAGALKLIGEESLEIDARRVPVVHLAGKLEMSGTIRGVMTLEVWFHRATGLPLRVTRDVTAEVSTPIGTHDYVEEFEGRMVSLAPRT